jgi:hypothetical protein
VWFIGAREEVCEDLGIWKGKIGNWKLLGVYLGLDGWKESWVV